MFRYKDKGNYYRFSIHENQGFSRLEKRVNGVFTTLTFNGRGPDFSHPHTVTIIVQGFSILVYLDGEPLFSAVDSSLTSGSVALYTQGGVAFDDVVVKTVDSTPKIIISTPVSYFVETTSALILRRLL
jgi:hypothetical protein